MTDVTLEDRIAAADLLDEISSLLDHVGIGQVADLIRDGEYDEHDATIAFARHRQATASSLAAENERLRAALERIRDMCPVTCEMTTAHEMAAEADAALQGE